MAVEKLENVKPTRMELLEITRKRQLASKGHRLLTEKRDALVTQFFQLLDKRKEIRSNTKQGTAEAYQLLKAAEMRYGTSSVVSMALAAEGNDNVDTTLISIMGVMVPHLEYNGPERTGTAYDPGDSGALLDDAAAEFRTSLERLIRLAEIEGAIEKMALEIEKTKRRVNALENVFIPRLEATERYISMQLEEREREDFFRRKRIKSIMERNSSDAT